MNIASLFVYGTLAPGKPNEHILGNKFGTWVEASVRGSLYQEGWGAALGYPGLVLDDNAEKVVGLVFSSDELPDLWSMLDEFEGEGYQRVLTTAEFTNGTKAQVYVYQIKKLNE
jgi:gamma-glutamylcyclotransferase (GGCT)/AIG2-like uncharacterized protein YtfP